MTSFGRGGEINHAARRAAFRDRAAQEPPTAKRNGSPPGIIRIIGAKLETVRGTPTRFSAALRGRIPGPHRTGNDQIIHFAIDYECRMIAEPVARESSQGASHPPVTRHTARNPPGHRHDARVTLRSAP